MMSRTVLSKYGMTYPKLKRSVRRKEERIKVWSEALTTMPQWSQPLAVKHLVMFDALCIEEKRHTSPVRAMAGKSCTQIRSPPRLRCAKHDILVGSRGVRW